MVVGFHASTQPTAEGGIYKVIATGTEWKEAISGALDISPTDS